MRSRPASAPAQVFAPVARAKPAVGGGKRTLGGFTLDLTAGIVPEDQMVIDPSYATVQVNPRTWSWAKDDNAVMGMFVHEKAEAVRTMQVRMVDLGPYKRADPARTVPPPPMGITLLCRDLERLVGEMTSLDPSDDVAVAAMAARYGKLRDTMATLRAAFTQAEGSFELAQELLIQKMGLE